MKSIDVTKLTIPELVKLLQSAGSPTTTEAQIKADIVMGLPLNEDETINIITYTAWLLKELN